MTVPTCTFTVAGERFGVEARHVETLLRSQPVTRVPRAPSAVRGLVNVGGRIVPAIDLRACLGLPERDAGEASNVVLRTPGGLVSLLVDELCDVLELEPTAPAALRTEPPVELPAVLANAPRDLLVGSGLHAGRRVWLLDALRVVELRPVDVA